jgi:hypothetical protein
VSVEKLRKKIWSVRLMVAQMMEWNCLQHKTKMRRRKSYEISRLISKKIVQLKWSSETVYGRPSNNKTSPESFFIISTADFWWIKSSWMCRKKRRKIFDYEGKISMMNDVTEVFPWEQFELWNGLGNFWVWCCANRFDRFVWGGFGLRVVEGKHVFVDWKLAGLRSFDSTKENYSCIGRIDEGCWMEVLDFITSWNHC